MADTPGSLDSSYALGSPEENRRFYAGWSATYDSDFAGPQEYLLPGHVADAFAMAGGTGPVLDVGAGTGLVGERLARHGIGPLDGVDISPEMLAQAAGKRLYSRLFEGDILSRIDAPDASYEGVVSSGTFTLGHVGPGALAELVRVGRPGALYVLSIRDRHYHEAGFEAAIALLSGRITARAAHTVRIYGQGAEPGHQDDCAYIVTFRRRQA
jgi:ubiquinone/menaquinone biosynthesis C-methylase UbiE